ncbi:hypothetical protein G5I_02182 [Acromyrmex echinatior]|uniref:Uncharacterized protein n=1 Tax=Acromyrmex echinatior TaxID=103372 RepID=F4W9M8_ACREC|nr:hypothetical protein G5I_02182 [Acromyrmex echinatior]
MHSRRTQDVVQDGRECNARYARDGSKVRQSERLVLPAQPIPHKRNTPRSRSLSLSLFHEPCRNSRGCQPEGHPIPKHQTSDGTVREVFRKQASVATSATTPSFRRYVVARSNLGTWYMAPQGLSHSVSIPRAAAHAVPSRERGLSNRRSGEARCRQLSAREKVEAKARRRQEEVKEEGQEMKEEEIPKSPFPCLKKIRLRIVKRFDFGLTTTELKVVKERRNSSTAAEKNAFTVGSHITTSSHSLIRPCGFFPRWMRADKNPSCQTKTESRHAGRSEMVHADGRELVNERTRAIH